MNKNNNVRNVFIVSGMHGNEYLGPTSILYAIKHLETPGTRIILFPLANPSGFDHNSRLVYPTNVDPNRDFPIEQYNKCYQSSSSLIIDRIYRKYHIDLTLTLHNGLS
jgi:predicted deacylase